VLDAGALIAFERNDVRVRTLIELAMLHGPHYTPPRVSSRRCGATAAGKHVSLV
jgi:hypothetical protein